MLSDHQISQCQAGIDRLALPVLPLVRLVGMLYLTGPFARLTDVLAELIEPVETGGLRYEEPAQTLTPYLEAMAPYERFKHPQAPSRIILSAELAALDQFEALEGWVAQNVVSQELEEINSLLCGPCACRLCCIGPEGQMVQDFFEIPLLESETAFFPLPKIDGIKSRQTNSEAIAPLEIDGLFFYDRPDPILIHWHTGWTMVLPRFTSCPNLDQSSGGCTIYPDRPDVCRRPQIFSYVLERLPAYDQHYEGRMLPAFSRQDKILAVWDCPYVKEFQEQIGIYAQLCGLEPVFKENKA
ncbi:MAG: YkgJ family cysteine cluster protein [Proteobacteria bacterium]|nr:YkgJ family cysteine cluster protein [Pseudomonadota bacterium]MBU1639426.1 YkgJ family cysteine cluster protein [Pseudomonadota bacterium]